MPRALLISVRFHDGRYHGAKDWPPAPARLFQALVSGAACGGQLSANARAAFCWLETLNEPVIATPTIRDGQGFKNYVPNNDLDAVGGDPRRIGKIRAPKVIRPRLFDASSSLLYAWSFDSGNEADNHAQAVCKIADGLYQLGRGVDMAWAWGEVLDESQIELRVARHGGVLHKSTKRGAGMTLLCPQEGSLKSLEDRFKQSRERFTVYKEGRKDQQLFSQAQKPRFSAVAYCSLPARLLFDLRAPASEVAFAPWPFMKAASFVKRVRDAATARLMTALPNQEAAIKRVLVGRNATEADKALRVRIVPLPSIGHMHADYAIRRVLVEIPPNCPFRADDIGWAFSGLTPFDTHDPETGEVQFEGPRLTPAFDRSMLQHYGADEPTGARLWRTITPVALPEGAARRRIDPSRIRERAEQKGGTERAREEGRAATAVLQALRHAGVTTGDVTIRVQREPFQARVARAESFASETRFSRQRLWHVEVEFPKPITGPLVIGDGRFLGLGLMAPVVEAPPAIHIFAIDAAEAPLLSAGDELVRALRRAVMARVDDEFRRGRERRNEPLPMIFTGHLADGAPARSGRHEHLFFLADDIDGDGRIDRLAVVAPHLADRNVGYDPNKRSAMRDHLRLLDRALVGLTVLRAGSAGAPRLLRLPEPGDDDPVLGRAKRWISGSHYRPTRHPKGGDAQAALAADLMAECVRRGLPRPEVEVLEVKVGPRGGLAARARLIFKVAVAGPLLLGRGSHFGAGMFRAER